MDLTAFFKMSYGLYVVCAQADGKRSGCIVNTVTQITAEPPKACVTVNKENYTTQLIRQAGCFSVVALVQDVPMEYIGRFGFASGRDTDKFQGIAFETDENRMPYPTEYAAARFSFKVTGEMDVGTHILFVGEATQAETLSDAQVMTYSYYHQVRRGKTPPKASSYQAGEPEAAQEKQPGGWRCKICGYVYEGDPLPEGFICPVCKKGAEFFERV